MGKIARVAIKNVPDYLMVNVKVPAGGLTAGSLVVADVS